MHKIFISKSNLTPNSQIQISGENFNHIKALRLKPKNQIILCDGNKNDYLCEIKNIYHNNAILLINQIKPSQTELQKKIILFQALPKLDKFELIIQKSIELGINKIIPIITSNSDIKKSPSLNKLLRWRKIAKSSAEQSGRGIIPEIFNPINFCAALDLTQKSHLNLISHEKSQTSIKKILAQNLNQNPNQIINIFIGPEGGFSPDEILLAQKNNLIPISLGKRILRTETAALFILSILIFQLEL